MTNEEAIEVLRQIADETLDDLTRRGRHGKVERWAAALNVAIGAIYKQQERERENMKNIRRM